MDYNQLDLDLEELKKRNATPSGKYIPVHCPRCKSRSVKFLAEYHKCLWLRILTPLFFFIACCFLFYGMVESLFFVLSGQENDEAGKYILGCIFGIISFIFYSIRIYRESKTHVQCVCPDCGKVWIHKY